MTPRRIFLILLSPIWLTLSLVSLLIGMAFFSGTNLTSIIAVLIPASAPEEQQLAELVVRIVLLPFQFIFIALVAWAALWIFRRRDRITRWALGDSLADRLATPESNEVALPTVLQPGRRRTVHEILSSVIAVAVIGLASLLSLGQFIAREDLAIVVAALTSSLAWGARLPLSDLLGGVSNILESNLAVGDRIAYRQIDNNVDGTVETVNLRFLSVRANTGELTSIPFGDLRVFRNYSRGEFIGVYAIFPIVAQDLRRAVSLLTELAPRSTELVPHLLEPWQPMSTDGQMGAIVDVMLFGKTTQSLEDDLQLAMHHLVREEFQAAGIRLAGKERTAE